MDEKTIEVLKTLSEDQIRALYQLIRFFESSATYENGILVSDSFEDAFISAFIGEDSTNPTPDGGV